MLLVGRKQSCRRFFEEGAGAAGDGIAGGLSLAGRAPAPVVVMARLGGDQESPRGRTQPRRPPRTVICFTSTKQNETDQASGFTKTPINGRWRYGLSDAKSLTNPVGVRISTCPASFPPYTSTAPTGAA